MRADCPDCGHELIDVVELLRENLAAKENEHDILESVNAVLGYYCSDCGDFHGHDELK